jgi:hypothetical protein
MLPEISNIAGKAGKLRACFRLTTPLLSVAYHGISAKTREKTFTSRGRSNSYNQRDTKNDEKQFTMSPFRINRIAFIEPFGLIFWKPFGINSYFPGKRKNGVKCSMRRVG